LPHSAHAGCVCVCVGALPARLQRPPPCSRLCGLCMSHVHTCMHARAHRPAGSPPTHTRARAHARAHTHTHIALRWTRFDAPRLSHGCGAVCVVAQPLFAALAVRRARACAGGGPPTQHLRLACVCVDAVGDRGPQHTVLLVTVCGGRPLQALLVGALVRWVAWMRCRGAVACAWWGVAAPCWAVAAAQPGCDDLCTGAVPSRVACRPLQPDAYSDACTCTFNRGVLHDRSAPVDARGWVCGPPCTRSAQHRAAAACDHV
jgi:hypothetical protein